VSELDVEAQAETRGQARLLEWVSARAFWLPKAGHRMEEYEDAYWPLTASDPTPAADIPSKQIQVARYAVADGATETSFSRLWANILVRAFGTGGLVPDSEDTDGTRQGEGDLARRLHPLQEAWQAALTGKSLPWYAEEKAQLGAFSALLGLTLWDGNTEDGRRYRGVAIGDSCLFHVRDDALISAFPLQRSTDFNSRPALLSSNPARNDELAGLITARTGSWQPGDVFYLLTDALACWILRRCEEARQQDEEGARQQGGKVDSPWPMLRRLTDQEDQEAFIRLVEEARAAETMRNDDVTLLSIRVGRQAPISSGPIRVTDGAEQRDMMSKTHAEAGKV